MKGIQEINRDNLPTCNWCKKPKTPHNYACKDLYNLVTARYLRTFELMNEAFNAKRVGADLRIEMAKEIMEFQVLNQKIDTIINGVATKH